MARGSRPQQGAVAAHPALQQQDDCQEEEPRKEQEGPRSRRARTVRVSNDVFMGTKQEGVVAQARGERERRRRGCWRRGVGKEASSLCVLGAGHA